MMKQRKIWCTSLSSDNFIPRPTTTSEMPLMTTHLMKTLRRCIASVDVIVKDAVTKL
jgi:hypothetical protein